MKNPNSYGSVAKLPGNRRKPWAVRITTGFTVDPDLGHAKQMRSYLGYYATRREAMQALAEYNQDPYNLDYNRITFRECYEEASKNFSPGRAHNYRSGARYLEPIMDLPIRSIRAAQMQACVDSCTTTQQREIRTVCKKIFEYALAHEYVDKNPAEHVHANSVPATIARDIFAPEHIADLFSHQHTWWARMALILLYTGMRTKELLDLDPDEIDLEGAMIYIGKAKNQSSIRKIPIHPDILDLCRGYKEDPDRRTYAALNYRLKKHYNRLPHDCRHTFTTRMRKQGCDLLVLQILLGHTPQTITERVYTHISDEELREAILLLDYGRGLKF